MKNNKKTEVKEKNETKNSESFESNKGLYMGLLFGCSMGLIFGVCYKNVALGFSMGCVFGVCMMQCFNEKPVANKDNKQENDLKEKNKENEENKNKEEK